MNRLRVIGLVVLAVLAAWFVLRSCGPQEPPPVPPLPPPREAFHAAKPLAVEIRHAATESSPEAVWLNREVRYLLGRGKMKVAPQSGNATPTPGAFVLRVTLDDAAMQMRLTLLAPDGVEERNETIPLAKESRLATIRTLASRLPPFLGAPAGAADWSAAVGTKDAGSYDAFINAGNALFDANAVGFTAPAKAAPDAVLNLERLEALTRRHRDFVRARALLSLAYLSVGSEDRSSLTKLAETAAERALAADAQQSDAQAALGVVRLGRMDWSAAQEHFDAALAIDANSLAALEGRACLLLSMGHIREALPIASRAVALQPGNRGARECRAYAQIAQNESPPAEANEPFDTARIHATILLLAGDRAGGEALLKRSFKGSNELIDAIVSASTTKQSVPEALQIITRSADEELIDAETEMLFGTALRRPDFVFNRMLRVAKQGEAMPLGLLWLPQTDFLRKHRRFKEVVSAGSLTTYWQDHGVPDVCTPEPKVHGCAVKPK